MAQKSTILGKYLLDDAVASLVLVDIQSVDFLAPNVAGKNCIIVG